jgi:hypothetical protein
VDKRYSNYKRNNQGEWHEKDRGYTSDIKLSDDKKKTPGKWTYIFSALMMLYGAGTMVDAGAMTGGGRNIIIGAVVFASGLAIMLAALIAPSLENRRSKKKVSRKYLRYAAVIGKYRRTPLALLSQELNTSKKAVQIDIQEMIFEGYYSDAYVDQDKEELIIPSNTMTRENMTRCPKCSAETMSYYNYCPLCGHSMSPDDVTEQEKISAQVRMYLGMVDSVRLFSSNEELIKCTEYFSELVSGILKRTEDRPQLMESRDIRNLYNLYLPKIAGALENYKEMVLQKIPAEKRLAVEDDLCQVFYKENMALVEITNKLNDDDILDISAEIDAIEGKLSRDGYSGSYTERQAV